MKTTITLQSDSSEKINLLIHVAHEMGIKTSADEISFSEEEKDWKLASEKTLSEDWLKPEENKWDDFIKSKLK